MARWNVGAKNGFWKGGRSVASNGYMLVRVGTCHHLADVRGYAYEHRLVAEKKLGRWLLPGEQTHHKDRNKLNNHPDNIEVTRSCAHHRFLHRSPRSKRRRPGECNPIVLCACGCGGGFRRYDGAGRPRRYITSAHVARKKTHG